MKNIPEVRLGIIAVSRDCFVASLSERRRKAVAEACGQKGIGLYEAQTLVENERDVQKAIDEVRREGCNALVVFLGNFGPETPETLLAERFPGPVLYAAAAEETGKDLIGGRGDAYCGMLNCSYNLALRGLRAVIPESPVETAEETAGQIEEFLPVARALLGVRSLKVIAFGPRPQDFFACNAPIRGLYNLGIEIQENSELDLLAAFRAHENDGRVGGIVEEMKEELGGAPYPDLLPRMAQFELTLLDWAEENRGARDYVAFANKCWPSFLKEFGFVPCYVNSRLTAKGYPVGCEVDIYGAVSEYIGTCVTNDAVALLDINNTVPQDLYDEAVRGRFGYRLRETFMGFHCGNTPSCKLSEGKLSYQLIQNRLLEQGGTPDLTRGTMEGDILPGPVTLFRVHAHADSSLAAYVAQGEVLPVSTHSFGGIGVIAVPEMERFYRHILVGKHYPHHGALAFGHAGKALFTVFDYLGVEDIAFNQPKSMLYPRENPFV